MATRKKGRPVGSGLGLGEIESVRFTSDQLKVIEEVRHELMTTRSEVIRKATTLGLPLVRAAMKIFVHPFKGGELATRHERDHFKT